MQRHARLALSVWIAVLAMIVLFTTFWRTGYVGPQLLWGVLSLAVVLIPFLCVATSTLWRCIRGPGRLRAIGWLLIGATPLVWIVAYVGQLMIDANQRVPMWIGTPARVTAVCVSSFFAIEARCRYSTWTRGRYAVLIDDGHSPKPEKLVAEMDRHIEAMAQRLGQPVPQVDFLWVRGSIFGFTGKTIYLWAICGDIHRWPWETPANLCYVDRHEVAHALITALSGPDQYPPCLLVEGWAESQSTDRNQQIQALVQLRRDGFALSLQELVEHRMYIQTGQPWAYSHGGPLVHYLMEHYGPAKFLRLYASVRPDTFHSDCRTILGDSWETVEKDFWKWLEAEGKRIAAANSKPPKPSARPRHTVEFAKSVDPDDWKTLVEHCRNVREPCSARPSNTAFILETEFTNRNAKNRRSPDQYHCKYSAVFEGRQFWMSGNCLRYANSFDTFLMSTTDRDAYVTFREPGVLSHGDGNTLPYGDIVPPPNYLSGNDVASYWFALDRDFDADETCRIERVVRPPAGTAGVWEVYFIRRFSKEEPETHYQMQVDPACRWLTTRIIGEASGKRTYEGFGKYGAVGDLFTMTQWTRHFNGINGDTTSARVQLQPMSETERREFKRHVEETIERCMPAGPHAWLRRLLQAIAITCPLSGVTLLGITRRKRLPPVAPPEQQAAAQ